MLWHLKMTTILLCVPKIYIDKNCLTDVEPEMIWTLDHEYTGQITKCAANFLTFLDNNMDKFNCLGSHSFAETYRSDEQEDLLSVVPMTTVHNNQAFIKPNVDKHACFSHVMSPYSLGPDVGARDKEIFNYIG